MNMNKEKTFSALNYLLPNPFDETHTSSNSFNEVSRVATISTPCSYLLLFLLVLLMITSNAKLATRNNLLIPQISYSAPS